MKAHLSLSLFSQIRHTLLPQAPQLFRQATTVSLLASAMFCSTALVAASPVQESFRAGLAAEEVARDLPEAIRLYEATLRLHAEDRVTAATALVRMADLNKRQGQTNAALSAYRRVLAEFPEQTNLVQLAQAQLPRSEAAPSRGFEKNGNARRRELIEQEIHLVEFDLNEMRRLVENGTASSAELRKMERDLLRLKRESIDAAPKDIVDVVTEPDRAIPPQAPVGMSARLHELQDRLQRQKDLLAGSSRDPVRFLLREQATPRLSAIQAKLDDLDLRAVELNTRTPRNSAEKEELEFSRDGSERQRKELRELQQVEVRAIQESIQLQTKILAEQLDILRAELNPAVAPEARVSLPRLERAPERFLVLGEVVRPGVYEILPGERVDLLRAIATAGGFTKIANPRKITVKRVVDGKEQLLQPNAKPPTDRESALAFMIQPDDQITVGERGFSF